MICNCGSIDCPRCYPGCDNRVYCCECDNSSPSWKSDEIMYYLDSRILGIEGHLCPDCLDSILAGILKDIQGMINFKNSYRGTIAEERILLESLNGLLTKCKE